MNQENITTYHVNKEEVLKDIFNREFKEWSNFDSWESIRAQQWIFSRALDICVGKKIVIKCDCCDCTNFLQSDFKNIKNEKCYGIRIAYMIKKVLNEIELAKKSRESDGTYRA